ncbi:hypothetical protein [Pseudalkalibacillus sp. SCS-8]|uniref:hypothetical protein n=1 Tax=Pseudalkalibacillus nanhaiensis TaxID=3115291 RepID=UPI0032DAF8AD
MSKIFETTVSINGTLIDVWEYFIALEENGSEWMGISQSLEKETDGEVHEGSRFVFYARGKKQTTTITEFEPMKKVTLTSVQGDFRADYTYHFINAAEATDVKLIAHCEAKGIMKLLSPLIKMAIKKSDQHHLEAMKTAYEKKRVT